VRIGPRFLSTSEHPGTSWSHPDNKQHAARPHRAPETPEQHERPALGLARTAE
jgi:hypothetical protein